MDEGHLRDIIRHPGADTRQWISYGIVQPDPSASEHSVRFKDADGNPLPHGALVDVKLEPSGIICPARVAMRTAGSGEGEWDPIGPGDEVLVAIPEGDERAGCCIIGRTSNSRARFPKTVAGQDTDNNSIVFRRYLSPYILESGNAIQLRNAKTGAQLALDPTGGAFFNSGDKHMLAMTAVAVSLSLGDGEASFQLDPATGIASIQSGGTSFQLGGTTTLPGVVDKTTSLFQTGGILKFQTAGGGGTGHAVTLEQLVMILANLINSLTAVSAFNPAWAGLISPPVVDTILSVAIAGANIPSPYAAPGPGGGIVASLPLTFGVAGVGGAINVGLANPLTGLDPTGLFPGSGRSGYML